MTARAFVWMGILVIGCDRGEPNPIPATRDTSLVGWWIQDFEVPRVFELREDGVAIVHVEVEGVLKKRSDGEWGASDTKFCISRSTTDTGPAYELVTFKIAPDGEFVAFSDFKGYYTRRPIIEASSQKHGPYTRYSWRKYVPPNSVRPRE